MTSSWKQISCDISEIKVNVWTFPLCTFIFPSAKQSPTFCLSTGNASKVWLRFLSPCRHPLCAGLRSEVKALSLTSLRCLTTFEVFPNIDTKTSSVVLSQSGLLGRLNKNKSVRQTQREHSQARLTADYNVLDLQAVLTARKIRVSELCV